MYQIIKNMIKSIRDFFRELKRYFWITHFNIRYHNKKGNCKIAKGAMLHKGVRLLFRRYGTVSIERNSNIQRNTRIVIDGGNLHIGMECSFGEHNVINVFDDVIFGDKVLTADRVNFISNIHSYEDVSIPICDQETLSGPIEIGDGTWFGINATVLPNTVIGKNCVIAAHAVVKGTFPDNCVIAGIPARIVKKYNREKNVWEKTDHIKGENNNVSYKK